MRRRCRDEQIEMIGISRDRLDRRSQCGSAAGYVEQECQLMMDGKLATYNLGESNADHSDEVLFASP